LENQHQDRRAPWWRREVCIYALLAAVTLAVYCQVWRFEFVNFDDPEYVTENNHVRAGLTWEGTVWAFKSLEAANWFPLTWLRTWRTARFSG